MKENTRLKVTAHDETGREINKEVKISDGYSGKILDFGWPVQYSIEGKYSLQELYPLGKDEKFYIDAGGRNHYGSGVFFTGVKFNSILEHFNIVEKHND